MAELGRIELVRVHQRSAAAEERRRPGMLWSRRLWGAFLPERRSPAGRPVQVERREAVVDETSELDSHELPDPSVSPDSPDLFER